MRLSVLSILPCLALAALAAPACSSSTPPSPGDEIIDTAKSAVINGQPDTTHQAVVALILQQGSQGGLCSGTMVKVDAARHIGWVLTAAHCVEVPPVIVIQGDDILAPTSLRYEVLDFLADSRYTGQTGSPYDFAVVRVAGVDASTPTLQMTSSPDGVSTGIPVTSVGYGRTTLINSGSQDENTKRRTVNKTLGSVQTQYIAYNMSSSGICQGDSGGPVLYNEKVIGVHSYVQGDCNGTGVSGRVTAGLSFINGELSKAPPADNCDFCEKVANSGNGECAALTQSCFSDPDCKAYYDCLSSGERKGNCLEKYPKAEGPFNAAANCTCTRACADKCGSTPTCQNTPKCGYKLPANDCTTCTESTCCQEALDCAADGTCYLCLKTKDKDPACADNARRKTLATCVASKCKTECAGSDLTNGADPNAGEEGGGGGGAATTTTTTSGCSVGHAGGRGAAPGLAILVGLALAATRRRRRN